MPNFATTFLESMLVQLPVLLVYIIGFAVAMATRARHARVSRLTILGAAIGMLVLVGFTALLTFLPFTRYNFALRAGNLYMVLGGVRSLLAAGGIGLWFSAIFSSRGEGQAGFPAREMAQRQ